MKEYRAYTLDFAGYIIARLDLLCETEDDAREHAKRIVDGSPVELWQGHRLIVRFDPTY